VRVKFGLLQRIDARRTSRLQHCILRGSKEVRIRHNHRAREEEEAQRRTSSAQFPIKHLDDLPFAALKTKRMSGRGQLQPLPSRYIRGEVEVVLNRGHLESDQPAQEKVTDFLNTIIESPIVSYAITLERV
jgi:hypothetical protein